MCIIDLQTHIGNFTKLTSITTRFDDRIVQRKKFNFIYLIIGFGTLSFLAICMSILSYSRMMKKQRGCDNMDLDLIKSITNRSILETVEELTKDEHMEIDRDNIKILEDLGEGAFGYVKRGIVVKDDMKMEVAVKMLKSEFFQLCCIISRSII